MNSALQIGKVDTPDRLAQTRAIYIESFPPSEQRPWHKIVDSGNTPHLEGIYVNGQIIGLITCWIFPTFQYIEHFAIASTARGRGLGEKVISAIIKRGVLAGLPTVLEVEPPCDRDPNSQPNRRIRFYERNGFSIVDRSYIQPPYSPDLPSVPLWLMSTDPDIDTAFVTATLHSKVYDLDSH